MRTKILLFILFLLPSFYLISSLLKERTIIITIVGVLIAVGIFILVLLFWYLFRKRLGKRDFLIYSLSPLVLIYFLGFLEATTYYYISFVFLVGLMGYLAGIFAISQRIKIGAILLVTSFAVIASYHYYFLPARYFYSYLNSFSPEKERLDSPRFYYLDGRLVDSSNYTGKIIVLNFWFTGCIPCEFKRPAFAQLYEYYRNHSEVFFADVHANTLKFTPIKEIENYLSRVIYPVPVFYDYDSYLSTKLGVQTMPVEIIFDKNLNVVSTYWGYQRYDRNLYLKNRMQIIDSLIAVQ